MCQSCPKYGKIVWADGGTKNSGDIVKCWPPELQLLSVVSQLAGCDECPVEIIIKDVKIQTLQRFGLFS
jgi:hypothetical protein